MTRNTATLYADDESPGDDPEGELSRTPIVEYDPRDEASLKRAREAVKARFGLDYLPVICNEPEPSVWAVLRRAAGGLFRRSPRAVSPAS